MSEIYRKVGKKYEKISNYEWNGFPCDGVWLVKDGARSASCITRLNDLPDPHPFYNMMLDRDNIASFLVKTFDGQPISLQDVADKLIVYLAKLNKTSKIHKIEKPKKFKK
jgi:hypothetical protein